MRSSLLCCVVVTFALLGNSSGNNFDEKFGDDLQDPEDGSVSSSNRNSAWHQTKATPNWNSGHFGLEKVDRHERRKQKKLERRKERQDRRERRKNRHQLHGSKTQMPILLPDSTSLLNGKSSHTIADDLSNTRLPFVPQNNGVSDFGWLESNISSIWLTLQYIQKDIKQLRRQFRINNQNKASKNDYTRTSTDQPCPSDWVEEPDACTDHQGLICGGKGKCSCGQCLCESPHYGIHCRCNDMICDSYGGVLCGGAGRGQCRCGACVCRSGFTGGACDCPLSTSECKKANEHICSGNGDCVCNRCQCQDGYTGKFCDESIYSASICERLKPCVLCIAYGKKYPQCEECNINVQIVDELASSRATCLMVNLGCILKYAYITPETEGQAMTVLVSGDRSCPK